jgi:hypothetical protein
MQFLKYQKDDSEHKKNIFKNLSEGFFRFYAILKIIKQDDSEHKKIEKVFLRFLCNF